MKKFALTVAVLSLGLAACEKNDAEVNAANDTAVENAAENDVDAAANSTENAAGNALDAASNAIDNAGEAVENAGEAVEDAADNAN